MIPLFKHFPVLAEKLPYLALGDFPTPVRKLGRLGSSIGAGALYLKHDGLSGKVYGGNKVRKLEFLLGKALRDGARELLTFGYAGSNHALATAIYAESLGLRTISMLLPQPNARYLRQNLLMSLRYDAGLHQHNGVNALVLASLVQLLSHRLRRGRWPRVIMPGGSSPWGTVGYVNAAYEVAEQVRGGELPEPQRIYVALGSMGTAVGLMLGLRAMGLSTSVVAVRIVDEATANPSRMVRLFRRTNGLLRSLDPSFPQVRLGVDEVEIRHGFFGERYGQFTEEGMEAVRRAYAEEGLKLEGTYTGKTLAALIDDAGRGTLAKGTTLFWNTYNARDLSEAAAGIDYRRLPVAFHRYFEQNPQLLDRG
ncbi:MAG: 1-aminocyclopropane-1-carboxylate deaminase/D-cysteine desulfhydrase [Candidatus Binatia bacterium]